MINQIMAGGVGSNEPKDPGTGTGRWHNTESPSTEVEDLAKELKRYTDYLDGITKPKPSKLRMYAMHRIAQIGHRLKRLANKEEGSGKDVKGNTKKAI